MKSKTQRSIGMLAATAAILALAACSGGGAAPDTAPSEGSGEADPFAPEQKELVVAGYPQNAFASIPVAMQNGIAEEYGISVELQPAENAPAMLAQVISGAIPIGAVNGFFSVPASIEGADVRIIGEVLRGTEDTQTVEVLDESIKTPKDLEGKRVGVVGLLSGHQARIETAVNADGGDSSKVEFVNLPWAEMVPNLQNDQVDAVSVTSIFQDAARALGTQKVIDLAIEPGLWPEFPDAQWLANGAWVDANPNTVAAFQCAVVLRGAEMANEDQEAYEDALRFFKYTEEGIANDIHPNLPAANEPATIIPEMMHELGWIDEEFDIAAITVPLPTNCDA
ncbi:ABC transporter substrate-binding protein [Agromyces sp. NPDC049794]|uniref:ABC transporter substrate-binding protein n=1 Tax=unclassified Agromyces TaxID=2639701 RepID=UPI0033DECB4B